MKASDEQFVCVDCGKEYIGYSNLRVCAKWKGGCGGRLQKAMKTKYKYIHFEEDDGDWACINSKHREWLGVVSFDSEWNQWVFRASGDAIFSASCLQDIIHFVGQLPTEATR